MAAVIGKLTNQVLRKYREAKAMSPATARRAADLGLDADRWHRKALGILLRRRVLVQAAPDTYYLDAAALDGLRVHQLFVLWARRLSRSAWSSWPSWYRGQQKSRPIAPAFFGFTA